MKANENWIIAGVTVAFALFIWFASQPAIEQEEQEKHQEQYIREHCTLIRLHISAKQSHYRCTDNIEYILNGLP
ncbi:hypothetical protein [Neisseria blantyrii]|uniref:hypothetical protein n=1 Tax=Neisseria blantyrii TaxID=2830647 RepID=UPI0026582823|nr:hypothetical protein [Neisseria blantyrii]